MSTHDSADREPREVDARLNAAEPPQDSRPNPPTPRDLDKSIPHSSGNAAEPPQDVAIATTVRRLRIIADWFEHGCKEISRDCQEAAREDVSYAAAALAAMARDKEYLTVAATNACIRAEQAERDVQLAREVRNSEADGRLKAERERDEAREDAERYRWLRDPPTGMHEQLCVCTPDNGLFGNQLDAAIDAARKGEE